MHVTQKQNPPDLLPDNSRREPVREFLKGLPRLDRKALGEDLLAAQHKWPVGMPLCRPMGAGLYEIRTTLQSRRIARTFIIYCQGHLVALHAFIKKTRTTPEEDLKIARKRQKETEHGKKE